LAALDYQETINFSFVDARWEHELAGNADPIKLVNPMAAHLAVMRSSLLGSLIGVLRLNLSRKATRVRVYEAGRTFRRDASVVDGPVSVAGVGQTLRIAGLAYGGADALQWGTKDRSVDFFDLKGDIEALLAPRIARFVAAEHPALHPGRCARIELDGVVIGHAGELVTHDALMQAIGAAKSARLIRSTRLFDVYKPTTPSGEMKAGERSLSVRLELLDDEVTLTDERIDAAIADVLSTLTQRLGVRLRA
jgi:phenylalanyl-tRNA synthetase beta chain